MTTASTHTDDYKGEYPLWVHLATSPTVSEGVRRYYREQIEGARHVRARLAAEQAAHSTDSTSY